MVKMTQTQLDRMTADMVAETSRLSVIQGQLKKRISTLENENGSIKDDLPEFFVNVKRTKGLVGDDQ